MKTNLTKIFAVMLASAALSLATFAQAPDNGAQKSAAATPGADQILNKYVAAIGGEAAWHKLSSRISKGTIEIPAMSLSGTVGRVIIDKTGLTGQYDIELTWAWRDDPGSGETGPSIFTALQEQLGLKLEPAKAPVDVVVIDHIERPSEN